MKRNLYGALAVAAVLTASAVPSRAGDITAIRFINHLKAGLNEIDVFVQRPGDPSSMVFRPTPSTKDSVVNAPLFAAARPIAHNPFDPDAVGPFPRGRPLGLTLRQWLAAEGTAMVSCEGKQGQVSAQFSGLVPNAVYTMWYAFVPQPPTKPFTGALDLPVGSRDGSQTVFKSDTRGNAHYEARFTPCLEPTNDQLMALLAIAWHSDGKTSGSSGGLFGRTSHVQIFAPLPRAKSVTN